MASVEDLYQQIILDHSKHPRNFRLLKDATHSANGDNPLCGDEIRVQLRVADGTITDARFTGQGCAISLASASMLTQVVVDRTSAEARLIAEQTLAELRGEHDMDTALKGDLASLAGVRKFPSRLKCATLPWHALLAALDGKKTISTESIDP